MTNREVSDESAAAAGETPTPISEHDALVAAIWSLEERLLAARRQGDGGLTSRLEIERTMSTLNVKKAELVALRAREADVAVGAIR